MSVPYEKDTTIKSDSKRRMMSSQDWMEAAHIKKELTIRKRPMSQFCPLTKDGVIARLNGISSNQEGLAI